MKVVFFCVVAFAVAVARCYEEDAARIVGFGGRDAKEREYPFFVNILELDRRTLIGAGVLLKSRVVLTTAYDFIKPYRPYKAEEIVIQVGMYNRFEEEPSTQFLSVEEIVPTFGSKNLITSTEEERRFVEGRGNCVVMGSGAIYVKKHIRFYPFVLKEFTPHMRSRKYCNTLSPVTLNRRLLCSHNNKTNDNANICFGDSGAPLLCTVGGQTKLVGLGNAYLYDYCGGGGSLFTGVAKYNEWIIKTAKMLQRDDED